MRAWLCVALVAAACGGGSGIGDDDDQPDAGSDATPDAPVADGWTKLIERSWQLGSNIEQFKCRRIAITEDTYISGFRALSPTGTHHELLTISTDSTAPVGDYDCSSSTQDPKLLFGGGIASNDFEFPPGVAIKLPAGSYINLNLHLLNVSDSTLSGTSGVYVKSVPANEVVHEADMMFLGTYAINVPPNNTPTVVSGSCVTPMDWTIINLWPHMHSYGVHQKVTVRRGGTSNVSTLLDADYSYTEQKNYPMPSMLIHANDELRVECTYVNDTNLTNPPGYEIVYGESASEEMCFTGFYKYPAGGGNAYACAPMM
ncbi:MAG TPA: hypothetical protein VFS15_29090 [Kofleriaceae bacterium]|nr:hypothetical protein [Kofleriaceae bacterium]